MASTQLPPNHLIGPNVQLVKQPDITATRNARTAKVSAISSSAQVLRQPFRRAYSRTLKPSNKTSPSILRPFFALPAPPAACANPTPAPPSDSLASFPPPSQTIRDILSCS